MHNVYKSSPRIRILWLSEIEGKADKYKLDFYDTTDIECVLTSLELSRLDKNNFQLSTKERERIENILKKAIDVETGAVPRPTVTEENPDGCKLIRTTVYTISNCNLLSVDLSLYKNESQIEKKLNSTGGAKTNKRKSTETVTPKAIASRRSVASSRSSSTTPLSKKAVGRKPKRSDSEDDEDEDYRPTAKKVSSNTPAATKTSKRLSTTNPEVAFFIISLCLSVRLCPSLCPSRQYKLCPSRHIYIDILYSQLRSNPLLKFCLFPRHRSRQLLVVTEQTDA